MSDFINLLRLDFEDLSAAEYLKLLKENRFSIKETQIIPGRLGDHELGGKIHVTYHTPLYKFPGDWQ